MEQTVIYLLMVQKLINLLIVSTQLNLGNISKNFSVDNMKNIGLNGYVYDFSVDYDAIGVDDILDTHKYLTKKNGIYFVVTKFHGKIISRIKQFAKNY